MAALSDAFDLLIADHRQIDDMLDIISTQPRDEKILRKHLNLLHGEILEHFMIEEKVVYAELRRLDPESPLVDESMREHEAVKNNLKLLENSSLRDPLFDERVKLLTDQIQRHVVHQESILFPVLSSKAPRARLEDIGSMIADIKSQRVLSPTSYPPTLRQSIEEIDSWEPPVPTTTTACRSDPGDFTPNRIPTPFPSPTPTFAPTHSYTIPPAFSTVENIPGMEPITYGMRGLSTTTPTGPTSPLLTPVLKQVIESRMVGSRYGLLPIPTSYLLQPQTPYVSGAREPEVMFQEPEIDTVMQPPTSYVTSTTTTSGGPGTGPGEPTVTQTEKSETSSTTYLPTRNPTPPPTSGQITTTTLRSSTSPPLEISEMSSNRQQLRGFKKFREKWHEKRVDHHSKKLEKHKADVSTILSNI